MATKALRLAPVDVCYARMACHVWGLLLLLLGGHEDK